MPEPTLPDEAPGAVDPAPPPRAAPPKPREFGNYLLLKCVGRGGMGEVFLAEHRLLKQMRAVKLLRSDYLRDAGNAHRFTREIEAIGKLSDPHVVRAHDAGEVRGVRYLAMEYVDGVNLSWLARHVGPLPPEIAAEFARQAALGLARVHEHGMVHRDIKPSNLLLTMQGVVKVADLGLARVRDASQQLSLTEQGDLLGTADYMAPEQGDSGRDVDIRADVYSLGCTLYKLLVGVAPFESPRYDTLPKKLAAHRSAPRPAPPPAVAHSPEWQEVFARLLARRPDERYATPCEAAAALAPLAAGVDLTPLLARLPELRQRHPDEPTPSALSETPARSTGLEATRSGWETHRSTWDSIARVCFSWPAALVGASVALLLIALGGAAYWAGLFPFAGEYQPESAIAPPGRAEPRSAWEPRLAAEARGSSDHSTPEPPKDAPPSPVDLIHDGDALTEMALTPVLDRKPFPLVWPANDVHATWGYTPERKQLTVMCNGMAFFQLGKIEGDNWSLRCKLHQPKWVGDVGFFFGFREWEDELGRRMFRTQVLRMRNTESFLTGERSWAFERGNIFTHYYASPLPAFNALWINSDRLGPFSYEQTLMIEVFDGHLATAFFGAQPLERITLATTNANWKREDYRGAFGLYVSGSSCVFRDAEFMRLTTPR